MEYEVGEWVWLRLHQRSAVTIDSVNAKLWSWHPSIFACHPPAFIHSFFSCYLATKSHPCIEIIRRNVLEMCQGLKGLSLL
jgi:hypothetical protein